MSSPRASERDLRTLAERVAGRVLAERARAEQGGRHVQLAHTAGVHVAVLAAGDQLEPEPRPESCSGAELVSAATLAGIPSGGVCDVPSGAIVTPLAEEAAHSRGIRFRYGSGARGSAGAARPLLALAADHGGFALKADVAAAARALGWEVLDLGTHSSAPVDYPDFAARAAELVASGQARLGVVIDAAGLGSAIAANKVPGVRAAPCATVELARNAREHNFANLLTLGARFLDRARAVAITEAFLSTQTGEERHARRVAKIEALERRHSRRLEPEPRVEGGRR